MNAVKTARMFGAALAVLGASVSVGYAADPMPTPPQPNGTIIGSNIDWGTIGSVVDFEVDNRMPSAWWTAPATPGSMVMKPFADYYSFSLADAKGFNSLIAPFNFIRDNITRLDVALFKYDSSDYLIPTMSRNTVAQLIGEANDDTSDSFSLVARGTSINLDTPSTLLSSGSYFLAVSGRIAGLEGGRYIGEAAFTAANAIPEPETWAMVFVGVGMVGFALRRQRRGVSAVSA